MSGGLLSGLAESLGTSENILNLFISLLLGYPLAAYHRNVVSRQSTFIQHLYFTVCGLLICLFNFGVHTYHSVLNILLIYAVLKTCGGTALSVMLAFAINMTYLTVGYYVTMSEDYMVTWTTPQCVLTLRLIGLVYDVYDGKRSLAALSAEERQTALQEVPSLLEISAHSYFFGGFLVGPQFSMKRYQDFIEKRLQDRYDAVADNREVSATAAKVSATHGSSVSEKPNEQLNLQQNFSEEAVASIGKGDGKKHGGVDKYSREGGCVKPALLRLVAGVVYIAVYQIGNGFLSDSMFLEQSFLESSLVYKCVAVALWGKLTLCKYLGCWLLAEGACIMTGMTYNGRDKNGNELWNGCANIHIRAYESAATCQDLILAFNVNTNKWMAKYIFKRLKFLGSKELSQGATLFFLAIWHGLHSGYFMNFFLEFLVIKFEREISSVLSQCKAVNTLLSLPGGMIGAWCIKKFYMQFILGYALISFCLFSFNKYYLVYSSMYFIGHIFLILVWPVLFTVLARNRQKSKRKAE